MTSAPAKHLTPVKTNFVLAWRADKRLERRITRQLNKGEALRRCAALGRPH